MTLSAEETRTRNNSASVAWRSRNREYHRMLQYASAARIRALSIKNLGGRCAWCSLSYSPVLEIDHIFSDRSLERHKRSHVYRAARGETDGLQLLCGNCHNDKTKGATGPEWLSHVKTVERS